MNSSASDRINRFIYASICGLNNEVKRRPVKHTFLLLLLFIILGLICVGFKSFDLACNARVQTTAQFLWRLEANKIRIRKDKCV